MKRIAAWILAATLMLGLCGCGHEHTWVEASCTEPRTCIECGETEGEPLGHTWVKATCTEPKTCSVCGATEGEAAGHKWEEATCTEPKRCSVCGITDGPPLGHNWREATVKSPKTCTRCGQKEGEPLVLFYWNEPVDLGSGYVACFFDDGNGNYRFEISNPNQSSATIYMLLENDAFSDYGIGASMYRWMNHILTEHRDFYQRGKMVYYTLNGMGGNNMLYYNYGDIDKEVNGIVGLQLNYSMDFLYNGTIGTR